MKFYQKSIDGTNSFCECRKEEATFYQNAAGDIKPVGELLNSNVNNTNFVNNIPTDSDTDNEEILPEPLPMPTMNFTDADEADETDEQVQQSLPLPVMKF